MSEQLPIDGSLPMDGSLPIEIPLLEVFQELRQLESQMQHQCADTESYLELVDMLRKGYFLQSREQLYFLCEKLWLKPFHNDRYPVNARILRQLIDKALLAYEEQGPTTQGPTAPGPGQVDPGTASGGSPGHKDAPGTPPGKRTPAKGTGQTGTGATGPGATGTADTQPLAEPGFDDPMRVGDTSLRLFIGDQPAAPAARATDIDDETQAQLLSKRYLVQGFYFPISTRRIEQTIRSYRYKGRKHGGAAIDVEATLQSIIRKGYFDEYERAKEYSYTTDWTLLIDHEGSMVPFHFLSEEIANIAIRQNAEGRDNIFYFSNCPVNFLYRDQEHRAAVKLAAFAAGPRRNILVISDAGAARGSFNETRIAGTKKMLQLLRQHKIAWLNPLPRRRWDNTSAAEIARAVDMFEIGDGNTDDLGNIVRVFKSKIGRIKS